MDIVHTAIRKPPMPAYRAVINGENFLVEMDGVIEKHGFFTVRSVSADDPAAAESMAVQVLRDDQKLRGLIKNTPDDPPTMSVNEIIEIETFDPNEQPELTWYRMWPAKR